MTVASIEKCNVSQNLDLTKNVESYKTVDLTKKTLKLTKELVFLFDAAPTHPLHCCTLAISNTINGSLTFNITFLLHICASHPHKLWMSCFWAGLGKQTFSSLLKFSFFQILIQENVRFKPPNQRQGAFLRVWAGGGEATLATTSLGGKVTAKLELEFGQPFYKHFLWSWSCSPVTILAIEGLLLRLSLEHQPNSLILKRLQLLLHQKELILQPQLLMVQIYTRNTYAY